MLIVGRVVMKRAAASEAAAAAAAAAAEAAADMGLVNPIICELEHELAE